MQSSLYQKIQMSKNYDPTKIQKRKRKSSSSSSSNNDIQFNNQYTAKKRSPPPPSSQKGDDDWWEAGTMNEVGVYSALDDDTLSLISKRLHVDVKLLLSQNITIFPSLKISSKLEEGTSIQIPGKSLIYLVNTAATRGGSRSSGELAFVTCHTRDLFSFYIFVVLIFTVHES